MCGGLQQQFLKLSICGGGFPQEIGLLPVLRVQYVRVCVVSWFAAVVSVARCVCSSGGLAAEEPGQRSERGPMRSHPHAEEKAPEHPELHTSSAQERPLETTGPAGKHQQHLDLKGAELTE